MQTCREKERQPNILDEKSKEKYNKFMMLVSRFTTDVFQTYSSKYNQDSYGYTKLSSSIPLFADIEKLKLYKEDTLEYGMIQTQLIKNRNRINNSLKILIDFADLYYDDLTNYKVIKL